MTLWVLIRSFVNEFRLSLSIAGVLCVLLYSSYCCIFQTPSMSSLSLTSTFLILNSPQSECLLCSTVNFLITSSWTSYLPGTPQGECSHQAASASRESPGSVSPSSIFKFSPCSASYSLFFSSRSFLALCFLATPCAHRSPSTFFLQCCFLQEIMPGKSYPYSCIWKVLKISGERIFGCLLFKAVLDTPEYKQCGILFWVHFIQMRTLKVTGVKVM